MDDLIAFLRARLDERGANAREVAKMAAEDQAWMDEPPSGEPNPWTLADVDAKRQIIDDHTTPHTVVDDFCVEEGGPCTHAGESWCSWHETHGCSTVRLLALPDAGHPEYRDEWRP